MRSWFFVLVLTAIAAFKGEAQGEISVLFCPSKEVPEAIETALDGAEKTLDVAIYSFTDVRLQTRLIDAAARGVVVRIILDDAPKSKFSPKLEAAGVDVRYVTNVMHHKFVIVDGATKKPLLLTGSVNWSRASYARFDEDLLRIDELNYVEAFRGEFESIWGHSRDYGSAIQPSKEFERVEFGSALFTSANLTPTTYRGEPSYRAGRNLPGVCGARIISAIDAARTSVKIASTHFRREDIAVALEKAMKRGVVVQLLLDSQEYHSPRTKIKNARFDESLASNGANVRYKFSTPYWDYRTALQMHCKYLIIDDFEVLTGSLNLSENSELRSFENLVSLTNKDVVAAYVQRFGVVWDYGKGKFAPLVQKIKRSGGSAPCRFDPISLEASEVAKLRSTYARNACRQR